MPPKASRPAPVVIVANASETLPQPMDALFAAVAPIVDELATSRTSRAGAP